ncbi:NEDD8 ultimate buster 1-like isoform X1 [Acipenser ruthenus]|uniref:NEDD8 ultimate buster 1-like isoform X1 n=2 Tax=Acipenser ruthenus TaxID=7906 RepID=UPI00274216DA|nr:NEDD8 ultimate buster 1-like isoform X1 [Acipenser ruthenus]
MTKTKTDTLSTDDCKVKPPLSIVVEERKSFQGQTFYNCFKGQMAQEEYLQLKLKTCLRSDNVQLGKAPHTTENNEAGQQAIKELAEKYAPNLNLNATEVESALEAVSSLTVKREKANETYKTEGVATLQIALPKEYKQGSQRHYLETTLDITSNQLIAMISEKFGVGTNMKLFLSGKTVGAGKTLQEQGVKHNSKIMVLSLKESEEDKQKMAVEEKQRQIINETITRTQKGFEILSERDGSMYPDTTPFLEITDQKGNPIKIPPAERKALILAMGLHEKGRTLLKKKDYETSLCLLLQADEQFSKCGPQLLNTVDNYAVLQLDIVWCYRALENLDYLENAKERLQKAESCFLKCYGEEQTRLLQIKGNSGREEVLFLRLYLLQGFLFFFQGEDKLAAEKVVKVEDMYMQLCVDPHQITQLVDLGYTEQEACLGLRACQGNFNEAANHISQRREEKAEMKRKERQKRRKHVDDINTLREMGCSKRDAARALHDAEGDLDHAFQILLDNNHLIETTSNDTESSDMDSSNREVLINQLGFDRDSAAAANVQPSTQLLVHHRGNLPPDVLPPPLRSSSSEEPSTSSNSAGSPINSDEQIDLDLVNEVLRDIPNHEEDYLDLNLEEESEVIAKLKSYLETKHQAPC